MNRKSALRLQYEYVGALGCVAECADWEGESMGSEFKWIVGSLFTVILFSAGLLIYGIIESTTSHAPPEPVTKDSGDGAVIKIDQWECVKGSDARGNPYQYSKNMRNGASGPASLACKKD